MNNKLNIKTLRAKTPEAIAQLTELENSKLNAFASPIVQDLVTRDWISFIYYRTSDLSNTPVKPEPTQIKEIIEKPVDNSSKQEKEAKKPFNPTKQTIEKWKRQSITKPTYGLLLSKGFTKEDIKNMKSQYDAYVCLKNLQKENI